MIEIREDRLRELLEQRKEYIGTSQIPFDGWFADVAFLMSLLLSDYKAIWAIPAHAVCIIFWILFCVYTVILLHKTYKIVKNPYTTKDLYEDIFNSADRAHAFNLIVIRNTFNNPSNKFLLLYDRRWKCSMLPYCKSGKTEDEDRKKVKDFISDRMGIKDLNAIKKIMVREHNKYSISDRVYKHYIHTFFEVDISSYAKQNPNCRITRDNFEIDGYMFEWLTTAQMMGNQTIKEKNKETVEDLMEYYGA